MKKKEEEQSAKQVKPHFATPFFLHLHFRYSHVLNVAAELLEVVRQIHWQEKGGCAPS
jgi:hypothetical protein